MGHTVLDVSADAHQDWCSICSIYREGVVVSLQSARHDQRMFMQYVQGRCSMRTTYTLRKIRSCRKRLKLRTEFDNLTGYGAGNVSLTSLSLTIHWRSRERHRLPPWLSACPVRTPLVAVTYVELATLRSMWKNGIRAGGLNRVMFEDCP